MNTLEFELVLPCYNEAATLTRLVDSVVQAAQESGYSPSTFQLVLVQNGSTDDTAGRLISLKEKQGQWFRVVNITRNRGYGHGIWMGLQDTTAPFIGWSHADLQCSPFDAFRALKLLRKLNTPTIVRGSRTHRDPKDRLVSRLFEGGSRLLLGLDAYEINAQPKVFTRELLLHVANPPPHFGFDLYVLYCAKKAAYRERLIDVSFPPRVCGTSKWAGSLWQRHRTIATMVRFMWGLFMSEGRA